MRFFSETKNLISLLLVMIFSVVFSGCSKSVVEKDDDRLNVVAVGFVQYDFARAVAGDSADVSMILKPGREYHGYEPSFSDVKKISESDIFIYNGGESDVWIHNLMNSMDRPLKRPVALFEGAKLIERKDHGHSHSHSHSHKESTHHHDGEEVNEMNFDEHIWLDFDNAIFFVEKICNEMCLADKENENQYRLNAKNYCDKIQELADYATEVKNEGNKDCIVVGDRFPYLYLTEYLGLEYLSAISGCGHESDANPSAIIKIIDKIRKEDIGVVLCSEMSDPSIARTIADETGTKVLTLHPCQTIGKADFESGKTYVDLMRENIESLKEALK